MPLPASRITRPTRSIAVGLAACAVLLTGCGQAGATTCGELGAMDSTEVTLLFRDLLTEHDLDPDDTGNIMGLTDNVMSFCGGSAVIGGDATQNLDQPLDGAVDWDSATW